MHHDLKLLAGFWPEKLDGRKPWELRNTEDRDFAAGDTVTFREVVHTPEPRGPHPTGRTYGPVTITYVLTGWSLPPFHCIFTHTQA